MSLLVSASDHKIEFTSLTLETIRIRDENLKQFTAVTYFTLDYSSLPPDVSNNIKSSKTDETRKEILIKYIRSNKSDYLALPEDPTGKKYFMIKIKLRDGKEGLVALSYVLDTKTVIPNFNVNQLSSSISDQSTDQTTNEVTTPVVKSQVSLKAKPTTKPIATPALIPIKASRPLERDIKGNQCTSTNSYIENIIESKKGDAFFNSLLEINFSPNEIEKTAQKELYNCLSISMDNSQGPTTFVSGGKGNYGYCNFQGKSGERWVWRNSHCTRNCMFKSACKTDDYMNLVYNSVALTSQCFNLNVDELFRIWNRESHFQIGVRSHSWAMGIAQINESGGTNGLYKILDYLKNPTKYKTDFKLPYNCQQSEEYCNQLERSCGKVLDKLKTLKEKTGPSLDACYRSAYHYTPLENMFLGAFLYYDNWNTKHTYVDSLKTLVESVAKKSKISLEQKERFAGIIRETAYNAGIGKVKAALQTLDDSKIHSKTDIETEFKSLLKKAGGTAENITYACNLEKSLILLENPDKTVDQMIKLFTDIRFIEKLKSKKYNKPGEFERKFRGTSNKQVMMDHLEYLVGTLKCIEVTKLLKSQDNKCESLQNVNYTPGSGSIDQTPQGATK